MPATSLQVTRPPLTVERWTSRRQRPMLPWGATISARLGRRAGAPGAADLHRRSQRGRQLAERLREQVLERTTGAAQLEHAELGTLDDAGVLDADGDLGGDRSVVRDHGVAVTHHGDRSGQADHALNGRPSGASPAPAEG